MRPLVISQLRAGSGSATEDKEICERYLAIATVAMKYQMKEEKGGQAAHVFLRTQEVVEGLNLFKVLSSTNGQQKTSFSDELISFFL